MQMAKHCQRCMLARIPFRALLDITIAGGQKSGHFLLANVSFILDYGGGQIRNELLPILCNLGVTLMCS